MDAGTEGTGMDSLTLASDLIDSPYSLCPPLPVGGSRISGVEDTGPSRYKAFCVGAYNLRPMVKFAVLRLDFFPSSLSPRFISG